MLTLLKHFDRLLTAIEPDDERAEAAASLSHQVRDFLKDSKLITTVPPYSRLAGSYARHTATKKIKDVDIILLVEFAYRDEDPEVVLDALFSALGGLAEALGDTGEVVVRRRQRRSIQVRLDTHDLDIDVVPAAAPSSIDQALEIPDKDWSKWVKTHPLGYGDCLSALNRGHGDKVVPLVKLWKHWRDVHMAYRRPKSYWLECMVFHKINTGAITTNDRSYAEMFQALLAALHDEYAPFLEEDDEVPEVKDPMLRHNVAHNWERAAFETFMRRLEEGCSWASKALAAETTDEAVQQWQKVFGKEWFPDAASIAREQGEALRAAGALFVNAKGHVSTIQLQGQPYVQAPRQRFYGGN